MAKPLWPVKLATSSFADYWRESSRPLASLVFILPMLLAYETALLTLGRHALRNGAEVWLRDGLMRLGFGHLLLLPLLTCGLLLSWHYLTHENWRVSPWTLSGMAIESVAFGFLLLGAVHLQACFFRPTLAFVNPSAAVPTATFGELIGYLGAGIYEELLFRLLLLPPTAAVLRFAGASRATSLITAVVVTSLLFSAAHYRFFTPYGEDFAWFSFAFRFIAGSFFASLFVCRGFGVAVGAHAAYDILVVLF